MNTSKPEQPNPDIASLDTATGSLNPHAIEAASLASGLPVEQLEQMANELFFALPGGHAGTSVDFDHQQIEAQSAAHPRALACANRLFGAVSSSEISSLKPENASASPFSEAPKAELSSWARHIQQSSGFSDYADQPDMAVNPLGHFPVNNVETLRSGIPGEAEFRKLLDRCLTASKPGITGRDAAPSFYFLDETIPTKGDWRTPAIASNYPPFDVGAVRRDFPILNERVNGRPLIWMDNAATTHKPQSVIDRISEFYRHENSNIHRAAHELAARATDAYEGARNTVARFLHASTSDEIVFVRGTTEAVNLVAQSWGRRNIGKDDEIVITWLEHHANIVPWQQLCSETGARLRVAPVDDSGQIILEEYEKLFNSRTKLASFTQVSNALGTVTPVREMVEIAHRYGARVLVDGAQSVSHMRVDVQSLDCDWFVFSGHKIFGPTGIGALYGKLDLLNSTPPWQGGGNMIQDVTFEKTVYQQAPGRFEAGTGNIADAVGLGAALEYVEKVGIENIGRYEHELLVYATQALSSIPGLRLIGTAADKASVLSFMLEGFKPEDVGAALNKAGIAVRSGHHCAQPILRRFGVESSVRPSLAFYNTYQEIDVLVLTLRNIQNRSVPI